MQDLWDEGGKQVAGLLVLAAVGAAWYFEWVSDAWTGWALLGLGLLGATVVATASGVGLGVGRRRALALVALAVAALGLAASAPVLVASPAVVLVGGDVSQASPHMALPVVGDGLSRLRLYLTAKPQPGVASAQVRVEVHPARGPVSSREGRLENRMPPSLGQRGPRGRNRHHLMWSAEADLSAGGEITVLAPKGGLAWPTRVELHRPPPGALWFAGAGAVLLLLGLPLDATSRPLTRSHAASLALGAAGFAIAFSNSYSPGGLTETAFGALLVGAVVGIGAGTPMTWVARRMLRAKEPA